MSPTKKRNAKKTKVDNQSEQGCSTGGNSSKNKLNAEQTKVDNQSEQGCSTSGKKKKPNAEQAKVDNQSEQGCSTSGKKNDPGLGKDYEIGVPAYFALSLNNNQEVKDFTLTSNAENFGNKLDDVVVNITKTDNSELNFALQLKHKESSHKNLLPIHFESKNNFNLDLYCVAYKTIRSTKKEKYECILYSNINFDQNKTNEVENFEMLQYKNCKGKRFFDTSQKDSVYKFKTKPDKDYDRTIKKDDKEYEITEQDFSDFFQQFSLYTNQKNYSDLEKDISKYFSDKQQCDVYLRFFWEWHRNDFTDKSLTKLTFNLILFNIYLSSFLIPRPLVDNKENLLLIESVMKTYDITVVKKTENEFFKGLEVEVEDGVSSLYLQLIESAMETYDITALPKTENEFKDLERENKDVKIVWEEKLLRFAKDNKLFKKWSKTIDSVATLLFFLYSSLQKPLVIRFNKESEKLIYQAIKLYKMQEMRIVLVGNEFDLEKFLDLKVFANLKNVAEADSQLYNEITRKCFISLQGREKISLDQLLENLKDVVEIIEPSHLIQMMQNDHLFVVGGEKQDLPPFYVNRSVSTYFFSLCFILEHCKKSKNVVIIQSDDETIKTEILKKGIEVIKIETYLTNGKDFKDFTVVVTHQECFQKCKKVFEEVTSECHHHYFKLVEEDKFLLIMSTQNTFNSENVEKKKDSIKETEIFKYFNNPINVLCSAPGSGKSTLLKYLQNKCPSDYWILHVDLKAYNEFFKENTKFEQFLDKLLQTNENIFESRLKEEFRKNKKIIVLMDGLDEMERKSITNVLECIKNLSMTECKIWLTTRENLQNLVDNTLNIFTINIDNLDKNQQKEYIKKRLGSTYKEEQIKKITEDIFKNVDVTHNQKLLGIPLQLYIITEILLDDKEQYQKLNQKFFVLSKMYKIFIEGRCGHWINKLETRYSHLVLDTLEQRLKNYQIAALVSLFNEELFNNSILQWVFNYYVKDFLNKVREKKDLLGLIVHVDENYKAIFEHFTFAEYFAARFIVDNPKFADVFKKYLFNEQYQNLLSFVNIMLAEDSSSHLSVTYRDFDQVCCEDTTCDQGGRNLLHLIGTVGTRHQHLYFRANKIFCQSDTFINKLLPFTAEDPQIKKVVCNVLQLPHSSKLQCQDTLFKWTPLDYALACGSLYVVEELLNKYGWPFNFDFDKYYSDMEILFHSLRNGYPNLLKTILPKIDISTLKTKLFMQELFAVVYFPQLHVRPECAKPIELIKQLIAKDSSLREIIFYLAAQWKNSKIVNFLIKDVRCVNLTFYKSTPLIAAIENEDIEMISLLLKHGADVNCKSDDVFYPPLHHAVKCIETLKLLVNAGADINACDSDGFNALYAAVKEGYINSAKFFLKKGLYFSKNLLAYVNFRIKDKSDIIPFMELLLDNGCDINETNDKHESVLHCVLQDGEKEAQMFVLERNSDVNLTTWFGDTVWHCAARNTLHCDEEILQWLLDKAGHLLYNLNEVKATALHIAVYWGNVKFVEFFLNEKIDLEKINLNCRRYPLNGALEDRRLQKGKLLELTKRMLGYQKSRGYL